jgi:hypothetical protein
MKQVLEHAKPTWIDQTLNGVTLIGFVDLYTPEEAEAAGNKLLRMVCEPIYFAEPDEEHDEWQVGLVR